jgi:C-terminal processing protease CtpA/Prc
LQVFLFIFTKVRYRTCITILKTQNRKHTMKLLLTACFAGFLPALTLAQAVPPLDATAKPAPFQPLVAKEHMGLGRIGVRLAFDKDTGLPHIIALTRGGPAADYGLRAGDVIIRIDKNYTTTLTQEEVSLALHGEPGTGVELTIQRDDDPHYIVRAVERRILRADQEDIAQPPRSEVGEATIPY